MPSTKQLIAEALAASQQGNSLLAMQKLGEAATIEPQSGIAHFLMAAEYAAARNYDEAQRCFQESLRREPNFAIARFQYGLLLLSSGQAIPAETTWQPLDTLADGHYLKLFRNGLVHLAHDQFDQARQALQAGITANTENLPLNHDMLQVIGRIDALQQPAQSDSPGDDTTSAQFLASAYGNRH